MGSERFLDRVKRLTLMDDILFRKVLSDHPELAEIVLRPILDKPDLRVEHVEIQKEGGEFSKRSVFFDVYATDSTGKIYNIEIQKSKDGAIPKRARYHIAVLAVGALDKGQDFSELPATYVIFITARDVLGKGRSLYHISRKIDPDGEPFEDDSHII